MVTRVRYCLRFLSALGTAASVLALSSGALAQSPLKVVELFTSQSCPNSPQADENLARIESMEGVLALSLPVTYWNYFGWEDTLSDPDFDARQKEYVDKQTGRYLYTPQVVINGREGLSGDDLDNLRARIEAAAPVAPLVIGTDGGSMQVSIPDGLSTHDAEIVFVSWRHDPVPVHITGGKNAGKTVTYHHVVETVETLSTMAAGQGGAVSFPLNADMSGDDCAVLMQDAETRAILGAGLCPGNDRQS